MKAFPSRPGMVWSVLALLTTMLVSAGCSDDVKYSYFDIHVTIDKTTVTSTQLYLVTGCQVHVVGPGISETASLRCRENRVPYDVGTFQWTTDVQSGTLQFIVRMVDANLVVIAEAMTDPLPVSPGKRTKLNLTAVGAITPPVPDAGADGTTVPGGGVDGAAVDGTDGSSAGDAAADGGTADGGAPDQMAPDAPSGDATTAADAAADGPG